MKQSTFFVILLWGMTNLNAQAQATTQEAVAQVTDTTWRAARRSEFNLKKGSTTQLTSGQNPATILSYYEFYLQEKDYASANAVVAEVLKLTDEVDYRYQISLISNSYTGDTKTTLLFLSDTARLGDYRAYFAKVNISTLKSNRDKWLHYHNLVALDSAYQQLNPHNSAQKKTSQHYNSLAWYSILNQKLNRVEYYLIQSMQYDPLSKNPYANMPLLLLLQGRYHKAKQLYIKYKDQPFDGPEFTYKDEFLIDFKELAAAGITNKYIAKITRLLNSR